MAKILRPTIPFLFVLLCFRLPAQTASPGLIPQPAQIEIQAGFIQLSEGLLFPENMPQEAKKAWSYLQYAANFGQYRRTGKGKAAFRFVSDKKLHPDNYLLRCDSSGITLTASSEKAFFYACQTLNQLMVLHPSGKLPLFQIDDRPAFSWRGLHLDVCRHFFSVAEVKKILRVMSFYKLNVFHWHLTDDQGWRIEISSYPELTRVGSRRKETRVGHAASGPPIRDGIPHGGFYSKEDIRSVVAFADSLGIMVVPEIEMPGHAQAAIAAYPWLGVHGKNPGVWTDWGVSPHILAPSDSVFQFLEAVLGEVIELFPSGYIHIGGDEAIKDQWKSSPRIQKQIRDLGLKDEHELQSWFIRRIEKFVNSKGRQIIGWDEILEGGLAPNAAVMSWRGETGGMEAARLKHPVVMSPGSPLYFDHYQSKDMGTEPLAIGGLNTLEMVYQYHPVPEKLEEAARPYILGAQGNLWTEYIADASQLEYMAFPRALALAEVCWTKKEKKNFPGFLKRLEDHRKILRNFGVQFKNWKSSE